VKSYKANAKPGARKDSLGALLETEYDDGKHLTHLQLLSNAFLLYVAGTETVSNAATFTLYELAKQPQLAADVAKELSEAGFTSVTDFNTQRLEQLPLLNAVIRESLRVYSPVGGPGDRESPPQGVDLGGYYIPGGVRSPTFPLLIKRSPCVVSRTLPAGIQRSIQTRTFTNPKGMGK
jgi:cytochrome P450